MKPGVLPPFCLISCLLWLLVLPYNPLADNEAGVEGFAELFPGVRYLAGVAVGGVAVICLILASLGALLGLLISAAIYHILTRIAVRSINADSYTTLRAIVYTSAAFART